MSSSALQFFLGLCLLVLLHVILVPTAVILIDAVTEPGYMLTLGMAWALAIGITQLAYVIPTVIGLLLLRRNAVAAGVVFGAMLTFLLNVGIFIID